MSFGNDWATFDDLYATDSGGGSWYDGALESVSDFGGSVYDGASSWLGQLMNFELQKEQLSYQNQLANQQAVLGAVEADQQTGQTPYSPNYREVAVSGGALGMDNKSLLILAGALVAAYLIVK